jgi:membrane-associated protease RseP (regulator of RpoE activity)
MQKKTTNRLVTLFTMVLFSTSLLAQETTVPTEKKLTITIQGTDTKGAKITRSVMKTGEEADKFDSDQYIKENSKDLTDISVTVRDRALKDNQKKHFNRNYDYKVNDCRTCEPNQKSFLGVSPENGQGKNDKNTEGGVKISVSRNSGAEKAGLQLGDALLQLNEAPIKSFNDISLFMRTTKPDDKIQVKYLRDGEIKTVTATLGRTDNTWNYTKFTNYNTNTTEKEKEACLGVYTSTGYHRGQDGAVINDFTPISAAQEVALKKGDAITSINGVAVKNHQELWDEIAKYKAKEMVRVAYTRDGNPLQLVNTTLKACKPTDESIVVVPPVKEIPKVENPKIDLSEQRQLKLQNFSTYPNPIQDMVNVQFQGDAVPTTVSFYDLTGRALFQQSLNNFDGTYNQRFDLSAYAKGIVVVRILQGEKVYSQRLVVN